MVYLVRVSQPEYSGENDDFIQTRLKYAVVQPGEGKRWLRPT